jgi:hypothetical protein
MMGWSRRNVLALAALISVVMTGAPACNDCDFLGKRCANNAVEQCGGVDQQIGRTVERTPCVALNPVCVSQGSSAHCAVAATATCTPGEARCEGNVLIRCGPLGFQVAADCTTIQVLRDGGGLQPAGYTCNTKAGSNPDCRSP